MRGTPNVGKASPIRSLTAAGIFLLAILPVLSVPILPTIDFYNHVARYFVLSHADNIPFLAQNYRPHWSLLPNIGMDVLGAAVTTLLPPRLAPHILTIVSMAVQFTGVLFFSRQLLGRLSLVTAVLLAPLMYSYIFVWGFANFLLGLGLTFWAAGWWLAWRGRLAVATPVACVLALVIFLCHGVAFALYGVLVAALELGFFLTSTDRRLGPAAVRLSALAVQAVAPAVMFVSTTTAKAENGVTNADESLHRLMETGRAAERVVDLICYRLQTIVRVAEGPSLWFDLATMMLAIAAIAVLALRGRATAPKVAWPAIGAGVILVLVTPPAMFGVGYIADRMPLFLAFVVVAALDVRLGKDALDRAAVGLLVALAVLRILCTGLEWRPYRADFAEFRTVAGQIPPGSLVVQVNATGEGHVIRSRRCEMYGPLLTLDGQATPLFANATQQPLRIVGPLKEAVDSLSSAALRADDVAPAIHDRYIGLAERAGGFDYLLVCGAERLAKPFAPGTTVVAHTSRFTLLKLTPH